jgi:ketosteroid isomerase-like protein
MAEPGTDVRSVEGSAPTGKAEPVLAAFDAMTGDGFDAMLPFVHEDFEMITPPELASEPGTYAGHDGVRRWFESFLEAVDRLRIEPLEVREGEHEVAVYFRMTARGRSTGLEAVQEATALCTVVDGKVHRMRFVPTWDEALREAGLPPDGDAGARGPS